MSTEPKASHQTQCCGTCQFMRRDGLPDLRQGVCRRFPPTATSHVVRGQVMKLTSYPVVTLADWGCHEYRPKQESTPVEDAADA